MMRRSSLSVVAPLLVMCGVMHAQEPLRLYVAPGGNDAAAGRSIDAPFATLVRARDEIHRLKTAGQLPRGATVLVRGGTYYLDKTLVLGPEDSGTPEHPVVYRAYENEKPVLVGGRPLTGFRPYRGEILQCDVKACGFDKVHFRQLFFDGRRQILARYPNFEPDNPFAGGWAYADGELVNMYQDVPDEKRNVLRYKTEDARDWAHPEEGQVLVFPRHNWWNNIIAVKSIDREKRAITLKRNASYAIRPGDRYFVFGLFEELDAPGEWYLDPRTQTLYFRPPAPLEGKTVCAPMTNRMLEIGAGAAHITFRGFVFECCEKSAIAINDTSHCLIAGNTVRNVGDYSSAAILVTKGKENRIVGNDIHDVGRDGIALGGGDEKTRTPAGNVADNNYIHHVGEFYRQGVGVSVHGVGNRVSRNLIHDGPRWGIGFGGNDHIIELNHIRHVSLQTEDTGAIYGGSYNWLSAHGIVIRHNYIHDMIGFGRHRTTKQWASRYFCWGIYLDWTPNGITVHGNIVARVPRACMMVHDGRDNLIENNIFVDGEQAQVEYSGWTTQTGFWTRRIDAWIKKYESVADQPAWHREGRILRDPRTAALPDGRTMHHNVLRRNILCYHNPEAMAIRFRNVSLADNPSDYNLIWHYGKPPRTGQFKIKEASGPNLSPNPGFEEGPPDEMPTSWRWQVRSTDKDQARASTERPHSGKRCLRIDSVPDPRRADKPSWAQRPIVKSSDIATRHGQVYRLTAWLRADRDGARAAMGAQAWKANAYHFHRNEPIRLGTDWQQHEIAFRIPGEGDPGYHAEMKDFYVHFSVAADQAVVWVDDVCLQTGTALSEWKAWQALGMDRHSLIADPLFVDAKKDDYRLQPNSPALKLGFKPIPVDKIGPYQDPLRASWPIVEAKGVREEGLGRGVVSAP